MLGKRPSWSTTLKVMAVVCSAVVLAVGTAQAVHSHADDLSGIPHRSCPICSTAGLGPVIATVAGPPVIGVVARVSVAEELIVAFRPATSHFIRPPPAA